MRADRLLSLLMLLQARGRMTAGELARELEVSERTVYRDLEALHAAGVPVLAERGPGGGCALPDKYRTDLTGLTDDEVRGLFMSIAPGPLSALGMDKALEAAMLKLQAALPAVHRSRAERVRGRVHVDTAHWFHPGEPVPHLKTLQEAVWQERRLIMSYQAANGARSRLYMDPYGLVAKAGVWYLVGVARGATRAFGVPQAQAQGARTGAGAGAGQDKTVFRVSRIRTAELAEETFEREAGFDLASYWAGWCADFEASLPRYRVALRVAADTLPTLPAVYGEGVRALIAEAPPPDSEGWTTIELTFESFDAARSSVLGLGTGAQVVAPLELREGVIKAAASIVAFYTGGTARAVAKLIAGG